MTTARARRWFGVFALLAASMLTACPDKQVTPSYVNDSDPQWVSQGTPHAKVAVVFIHGLTGDTLGTWTNANGTSFFSLLKASPSVGPQVDVYAFGFTSQMVQSGSLDVREAANKLHESLKGSGVLDYPGIVFVAHSMGGLVTLRYLISHRELVGKVPAVVLFATPQEGAQIASVGQFILNNAATRQMIPADGNDFLQTLSDDWRTLPSRPHVVCGYEKAPIAQAVLVVPWSSATRFCDGASVAIGGATHLSIVKPDRPAHDSVVLLVNALNDYAVGKNLTAELDTPDFVKEADHWSYTLADPNGKSSARLVNTGKAKLRYEVREISDPALFLWPDDTPKDLAGETTERLSMALGHGASASEYRFVLKSDAGETRRVIVHVKDAKAVQAQRAELQDASVRALNDFLARPGQVAALQGGSKDEALQSLVKTAHGAVARQAPNLDPSAQWTMTADVLAAANWPLLAQSALKTAERLSPSVARSPGGRHLAEQVASAAGVDPVFAQVPVPAPSTAPATPMPWFTTQQQLANSAALAARLQEVPSLRSYGLSLQGDVLQAQGNRDDARRAYAGAADLQKTPSLAKRMKALDKPGASLESQTIIADVPTKKNAIAAQRPPADLRRKTDAVKGTPS